MKTPEGSVDDVFAPGGNLRLELLEDSAASAVRESIRLARETRWDSLRSPHIFMGLLAAAEPHVNTWAERLGTTLPNLLSQFQELFHQKQGDPEAVLALNREFLSDNVILLLREAYSRANERQRSRITAMDLLIALLTVPNSIVATCFENIGYTAAKLTELAVLAEQQAR